MGNIIAALTPSIPCKQPGRACPWIFDPPQARSKAIAGPAPAKALPAPVAEVAPEPCLAEPQNEGPAVFIAEHGDVESPQHDNDESPQEDRLGEDEDDWHAIYAAPPEWEKTERSQTVRFNVDDASALTYLKQNGYVVFASVLNSEEVKEAKGLFWDWLEAATKGQVRRDSVQSWGSQSWLGQDSNGIIGAAGAGQSIFMWFVRTRPRVLQAFANIWGLADIQDLIISFDGCGAFRPTSANPAWRTRGGWFHTDQNGRTTGSEFVCAQGLVTLFDSDESTGSLAVLPGSHKQHRKVFQRWPLSRSNDFFQLPRCDSLLVGKKAIMPRLVRARAGDLLIWDSRCFHCNVPAPHPFDYASLRAALESAGLSDAIEPMCEQFTSVSDVVWIYNLLGAQRARLMMMRCDSSSLTH